MDTYLIFGAVIFTATVVFITARVFSAEAPLDKTFNMWYTIWQVIKYRRLYVSDSNG